MEETEKIVDSLVEITLTDPQDFLKIKETLTRIGVSSRVGNKLYQSCHILHKRGKYYITHFKELFALDGLPSKMSEEDIGRRNTIVGLLSEWGLCEIVDTDKCEEPLTSLRRIKILSHKNRDEWELIPKYHIGKKPAKDE
jgi:hypothetical protein|tara:strand:+ start:239 stop:658 length:420 start_codon:yes stop_codon:yes gene_type:complete